MPRPLYPFAALALALGNCAQPSKQTSAAIPSLSTAAAAEPSPPATIDASAGSTSAARARVGVEPSPAAAGPDAEATPPTDPRAGAPAQFRGCALDTDCIAVDRIGCCHNGWQEAVA